MLFVLEDANHETTILTGVVSSQGRDIKDIKNRIHDFDQRFASLEEKLDQGLQILTTLPKTDK
jgi:hypothetical protein